MTNDQLDALERQPVTHDVKCWPVPFAAVRSRAKPWELRLNDRDYRTGDALRQHEWSPETNDYTGEVEAHRIGWMLHGPAFGLPAGYVIMTLDDQEAASDPYTLAGYEARNGRSETKTPPPNAGEGLLSLRSRNRTDCPGCGVASGYMHKADCPVLAQALRSNSPEAG